MHALISVVRAMCLTNRLWVGWGKVSSTHHDVLRVRRICSSSDASGRDRVYRGAWDVRSDDRSCDESHARTSVTCPPLAPLSRPGKRLLDRPRFFAWDVTPRRMCRSGTYARGMHGMAWDCMDDPGRVSFQAALATDCIDHSTNSGEPTYARNPLFGSAHVCTPPAAPHTAGGARAIPRDPTQTHIHIHTCVVVPLQNP